MEYPQKISIKVRTVNEDTLQSMIEWTNDVVSKNYAVQFDDFILGSYRFIFTDPKSAMLFNLRWAECLA
jgi:hypothetical protein